MKIAACIALLTLSLLMNNACAGTNTVIGTVSCKQWLDSQRNPANREAYTIWLYGYLSGSNAMYGEMLDRDFLKEADKVPLAGWTDAYCDKYPDAMLQDGAYALVKLLKREQPF